jgi:hypothetical protein
MEEVLQVLKPPPAAESFEIVHS